MQHAWQRRWNLVVPAIINHANETQRRVESTATRILKSENTDNYGGVCS